MDAGKAANRVALIILGLMLAAMPMLLIALVRPGVAAVAVLFLMATLPLGMLWAILWLWADRLAKISTPNLLCLWILLTMLAAAAIKRWDVDELEILGVREDLSVILGVAFFLLLAGTQLWLRRRWRADGCEAHTDAATGPNA